MAWLRNIIPDLLSTSPLGLTSNIPNPQQIFESER
jgi:hypothetical protein